MKGRYTVVECGFESACWIWNGRRDEWGYGCIEHDGKTMKAHRLSYLLHFGEIPNGLHVHHLCEQRACVNPEHLCAITPTQHRRLHSILSPEQVDAIRIAEGTQKAIAERFGVAKSTVWRIKSRTAWS